jgi:hypothetical protein
MLSRATRRSSPLPVIVLAGLAALVPVLAQERADNSRPVVTAAQYAQAEKFLSQTLNPLAVGGSVTPAWLPDNRFTYRRTTADGSEFLLVDPVKRTRGPAFDHAKIAAALSAATGAKYTERQLPFQAIELSTDGNTVSFDIGARRWSCDVQGTKCADAGAARGGEAQGDAGRRPAGPGRCARPRSHRPTASAPCSSATGTCGCATSQRTRRSR